MADQTIGFHDVSLLNSLALFVAFFPWNGISASIYVVKVQKSRYAKYTLLARMMCGCLLLLSCGSKGGKVKEEKDE